MCWVVTRALGTSDSAVVHTRDAPEVAELQQTEGFAGSNGV